MFDDMMANENMIDEAKLLHLDLKESSRKADTLASKRSERERVVRHPVRSFKNGLDARARIAFDRRS